MPAFAGMSGARGSPRQTPPSPNPLKLERSDRKFALMRSIFLFSTVHCAVLENPSIYLLPHRRRPYMSSTTETAHWPDAAPRRADNVEIAPRISEDWLSLIIGLFIFGLALGAVANIDLLGWLVSTSTWTDLTKA